MAQGRHHEGHRPVQGHAVEEAGDAHEALDAVARRAPDVILLDLQLPGRSGLEALPALIEAAPAARVLMMTAHGSIASAVSAMRAGAWDYLTKPFGNDEELLARLAHVQEVNRLTDEVATQRAELESRYGLDELVGSSPRMAGVFATIRKVAPLLRVLQDRTFTRIGGQRQLEADFRLNGATNADLEEAVATRRFREDLYWRLNVITIRVPPLRERPEDLPTLVDHLVAKRASELGVPARTVSPEAMEVLRRYPWPGNVRELENTLYRALVMAEGDQIGMVDLPPRLPRGTRPPPCRGGGKHGGTSAQRRREGRDEAR